ncbi:histidine acid phosphatase [Trichuris suis]|nr:histidine acid phosphatase [Trichuris suis]
MVCRSANFIKLTFFLILSEHWSSIAKVVYVHVLFRHGERTPLATYPNDAYQENAWPNGFGQLTKKGCEQQYELGLQLRQRYGDLLSERYVASEIYVLASDHDRTINSATCALAGLFPQSNGEACNKGLLLHPVPVHTTCRGNDLVSEIMEIGFWRLLCEVELFRGDSICPAVKARKVDQSSSNESLIPKKYEEMFVQLQQLTGWNPMTLKRMSRLADTLLLEKEAGMQIPQWATDQWMDAEENRTMPFLDVATKLRWYWQSIQVDSDEKVASISGFLVDNIVRKLERKVLHPLKKPTKMRLYAMHDKNMRSLLCSLGSCSIENPPFSSCIAIELHEKAHGEFAVEIFYRNSTGAFQPVFIGPCESFVCNVEEFKRSLAHLTLRDGIEIRQACYRNKSSEC